MPLEELDDEIRLVNWPTCNGSLIPSSKNHSRGAPTGRSPVRQIARTPLSTDAPFMEVCKKKEKAASTSSHRSNDSPNLHCRSNTGERTKFFIAHTTVFLPSMLANPCTMHSEVKNAQIDERDEAIIEYFCIPWKCFSLVQRYSIVRERKVPHLRMRIRVAFHPRFVSSEYFGGDLCPGEMASTIPYRISTLLSFLRYRSWQTTALC